MSLVLIELVTFTDDTQYIASIALPVLKRNSKVKRKIKDDINIMTFCLH